MKRTLYAILFTFLITPSLRADEIKIGIITDLSSHGAFWGKQTAIGAQILLEELKEKGSDNIQFIFADTAFKPSEAASEAHRLIDIEKVDAIYTEFSSITNAVSPIALKSNKLLVSTTAAVSFLNTNPYAFKAFLNYELGCKKIGNYWKEQGIENAGILKVTTEIGELCNKGAKEVFPKLEERIFNPAETISSLLLTLKSKKVNAIFSTGYEVDNLNMLKGMKTLKYSPFIAGPDPDFLTDKVTELYTDNLKNVTTFGYQPIPDSFREKVKKNSNNLMKGIEAAANSYLFLGQMVKAIQACKKADLACQIKSLESEGPNELLKFKGWLGRQANHEFAIIEWKNGKKITKETFSLSID